MRHCILRTALSLLLAAAPAALAEETSPTASPAERPLTGKERLGPKWSDEQRVDDCKVPADKRTTERPTDCTKAPSS